MAETFAGVWLVARWICTALAGCIIFRKAGRAGWKSLVPIYSGIIYYEMVWEKEFYYVYLLGAFACAVIVQLAYATPLAVFIIFAVIAASAVVIRAVFCYRLAAGFGKGFLYAAGLFLFEPVFKVLLAAGACEFVKKEETGEKAETQSNTALRKRVGACVCLALIAGYAANIYVQCTGYVWITEKNFPDKNFRHYLRSQLYGRDLKLSDSEIDTLTVIECNEYGITTLEGIELLPKLGVIECAGNELTSLDLSRNGFVRYLDCTDNDIEELKLSKSGLLGALLCAENRISELELGSYLYLSELDCRDNRLTSLDVRGNHFVTTVFFSGNSILHFTGWDGKRDHIEVEYDRQICEVPVTYDEESGTYKSAEEVLDISATVQGAGVTFDSENGQLTVEDPANCEATFQVDGNLWEDRDGNTTLFSGELHFVEAEQAEENGE